VLKSVGVYHSFSILRRSLSTLYIFPVIPLLLITMPPLVIGYLKRFAPPFCSIPQGLEIPAVVEDHISIPQGRTIITLDPHIPELDPRDLEHLQKVDEVIVGGLIVTAVGAQI